METSLRLIWTDEILSRHEEHRAAVRERRGNVPGTIAPSRCRDAPLGSSRPWEERPPLGPLVAQSTMIQSRFAFVLTAALPSPGLSSAQDKPPCLEERHRLHHDPKA